MIPSTVKAPNTKYHQGLYYYHGSNPWYKINKVEGLRLLVESATEGHIDAQLFLARLYEQEKNYQQALYWYEKAAQSETAAEAQYKTGYFYEKGLGCNKPDYGRAHQYYLSAHYIIPEACLGLSILYRDGLGLPHDWKIASDYFEQAQNLQANLEEDSPELLQRFQEALLTESAIPTLTIADLSINIIHPKVEGAYASVHKGKIRSNKKDIAVKKFKNQDNYDQFENEVNIMVKLHSEYLVYIYGMLYPQFIVMEWLAGGSLYDALFIKRIAMSWSEKLIIAIDTLKGLSYLHQHKPIILHRDVKSENVLLDGKGHAKLCDYGCAVIGYEQIQSSVGTIDYGAPELYLSPPRQDAYSDIYSYAITVYELMTGKEAFKGMAKMKIPQHIKTGGRPSFSLDVIKTEIPTAVQKIIENAWSATHRSSAKEILPELEQISNNLKLSK